MKRRLCILACALLGSCALFTPDTEPALQAVQAIGRSVDRIEDRMERVLATAGDPAAAEKLRAAFVADIDAVRRMDAALLDWIAAVGSVDWRKLFEEGVRGGK